MRASQLGLLSDDNKRRAFMEMNARNWRKREPVAIPLEHPQVFKKVLGILKSRHPNISLEAACGGIATSDVAAVLGFQVRPTDNACNTEHNNE